MQELQFIKKIKTVCRPWMMYFIFICVCMSVCVIHQSITVPEMNIAILYTVANVTINWITPNPDFPVPKILPFALHRLTFCQWSTQMWAELWAPLSWQHVLVCATSTGHFHATHTYAWTSFQLSTDDEPTAEKKQLVELYHVVLV